MAVLKPSPTFQLVIDDTFDGFLTMFVLYLVKLKLHFVGSVDQQHLVFVETVIPYLQDILRRQRLVADLHHDYG